MVHLGRSNVKQMREAPINQVRFIEMPVDEKSAWVDFLVSFYYFQYFPLSIDAYISQGISDE